MKDTIQNNSGSVLAAALILLAVLTIMGITGISTSSTEIRIAANDMRHRQVFYQADGCARIAVELIEQSFACQNHLPQSLTIGSAQVQILNPHFTEPAPDTSTKDMQITSKNGQFITGIKISSTFSGSGTPDMMTTPPSGQEYILYEIISESRDHGNNAIARIKVCYRHVLGQNIPCPYKENASAQTIPGALPSKIISWEVIE